MRVKLTTRERRGIIIIDAGGKLTMGEGTAALREMRRALEEAGYRRILLNMADVTYIDSAGIGELAAWHEAIADSGGAMKLLNLASRVRDVLQVTKLHMVFESFEDESAAVASFPMVTPSDLHVRYHRFFRRIVNHSLRRKQVAFPAH